MRKTLHFLLIFILLTPVHSWAQKPSKAQYAPGVVVFKLKPNQISTYVDRESTLAMPETVSEKLKKKSGANTIYQPFGTAKNAKTKIQLLKQGSSHLEGIYKMELPEGASVEEVVEMLKQQPEVLYAEPYFLPELLDTPNDPLYPHQGYLPVIKAPQAWAIQKGSPDIIIGILDSGVDFNHPDLQANLHVNGNDPVNGIDDDGDGFIDNYRGWDFANRDNNPTADKSAHGTWVTGVCAASTNNAVGIAGTGYNTKYMPIKIFTSQTGTFANGYEAIAYAANMGCSIINLSWGAASSPSEYVQDIINYAVLEKDVVVVAAAGNTKAELDFYPASYTNVLSVTATETNDTKADWCTWSRFVDIVAPGVTYTTSNGGGYRAPRGTSFSSPQVAGAAALVRAKFPELSAVQVMEVLRMAADDIYGIGTNSTFINRLGRGRLNMEKALQAPTSPAVRMNTFAYTNGFGSYAFHNDTIQLWMNFTNYLNTATDLKVKLISESGYAVVMEEEINLGTLNPMEKLSSLDRPFKFRLTSDLPALANLSFRLEFSSAEGYKDYQYFNFRTSGEYIDFKIDELTLTVASSGNLGYNYDYNLQGLGLRYENSPLAHNMGLIIAQSPTAIANNVVNKTVPARRDLDFKTLERLRLYSHTPASLDARSSFEVRQDLQVHKDSVRLNLQVDQKILGWNSETTGAAIVLEYRIINRADTAYKNLQVALFSDFNLNDFFLNRANWDATHKLGYTYDESTGRYAGIAVLSGQDLLHHALDLNTREGNTAEISTTMSRKQKWGFVSNGIDKTTAGVHGSGNDVAHFLGGTIGSLGPKSAEKVVFAMVTAPSLAELQQATLKARENYSTYITTVPLLASLETCSGETLVVTPKAGSLFNFYSQASSLSPAASGESITLTALTKDTTFFASIIDNAWPGELQRIEVKVNPAVSASFSMSAVELLLNAGLDETVSFSGISQSVLSWEWGFGNGQISTLQNPVIAFSETGTYQIKAVATSDKGCKLLLSQTLTVLRKEDAPVLTNVQLCLKEKALIQEADNRTINVFADAEKQTLLYTGAVYESQPLQETKTFYVSVGSGVTESNLTTFTATVHQAGLGISHATDLNATSPYALLLTADIANNEGIEQINWYQETTLLGSGETISLAYDARAEVPEIRLEVKFTNGCTHELLHQLPLTKVPVETLAPLEVCLGEEPLISPEKEGVYYFYADEALENLLHKGRFYQLGAVEANQSFYITNLIGGLESEAVELPISLPEGLATFELLLEPQQLHGKEAMVAFSSTSTQATEWMWSFGDGTISTEQHPMHTYTVAGTYTVTLVARNSRGCEQILEQQVVISNKSVFGSNKTAPLEIYPNPSRVPITILVPEQVKFKATLLVLNSSGGVLLQQELHSTQKIQLDLTSHPAGMYLVRIISGGKVWQSRMINLK